MRCVTVDVVEAEGDGEGEAIGVAAVPAAGPDLSHLQAAAERRVRGGSGNGGAAVGALCTHLDGETGVGEEELELRGDEGRERRARCGGGRGGVGGWRHRRRRRWLAMDSAALPQPFFPFGIRKGSNKGGIGLLLICLWSVVAHRP